MTDQERAEAERAWEAYREKCQPGWESLDEWRRNAFLAGWARQRAKAKPLVVECYRDYPGFNSGGLTLTGQVQRWCEGLPDGTRFKVTVEEV